MLRRTASWTPPQEDLEGTFLAHSVTLAPIEDSLQLLMKSEGRDEIPDEELNARFIEPYMADANALVKLGHVLTLRDENGKKLEFIVSSVTLEGEEAGAEEVEDNAGTTLF